VVLSFRWIEYRVKSETSELGKSMRGQTRRSPVLVQRAALPRKKVKVEAQVER
jgi:hypothetical protein